MNEQASVSKPSLIRMIWSPGEQFERMRERPSIWVPLIIVTLLSLIASVVSELAIPDDYYQVEGFQLSEQELATAKKIGMVGAILGGLFVPVIAIVISSLIYWLITTLARTEASFKQLFSLTTYVYFISAIGGLLNSLVLLAVQGNPEVMVTSLGSVVQVEGAMGGLLNGIEIFTIWGTILTALGLHKVAGLLKGAAWTVAIVFFVIGLIFAAIGGAFSGMAGV